MIRVVSIIFFVLISALTSAAQDSTWKGPPFESKSREAPAFIPMNSEELEKIVFYDQEDISRSLGDFYRNTFTAPSQEHLYRRLEELRAEQRPIPIYEFLGDRIESVTLLYREPSFTLDQTVVQVKELLRSVILSPDHPYSGPGLDISWSEMVFLEIKAMVRYANGTYGVFEHGGSHLVFQDSTGVFWWHRWDASFPRCVLTREDDTEEEPSTTLDEP